MKISFLALLIVLGLAVQAQDKKPNPKYDETLAKQVNADDYGMKMYVLAILKTGSNTTETKAKTDSLFAGHMTNISRLANIKKLVLAGPLTKNEKNYRGIFIFNVKTIEEAKELLATDPAVKAKLLDADFFNWYGSAALSEYLKFDEKVGKFKF